MTAEVDNLLVGDGIDRARGKGETGVHLAHVLDEIDAGCVDRVKGRELSAVEYGQNKGVVVNRKLSGHPVIKGVDGHIYGAFYSFVLEMLEFLADKIYRLGRVRGCVIVHNFKRYSRPLGEVSTNRAVFSA